MGMDCVGGTAKRINEAIEKMRLSTAVATSRILVPIDQEAGVVRRRASTPGVCRGVRSLGRKSLLRSCCQSLILSSEGSGCVGQRVDVWASRVTCHASIVMKRPSAETISDRREQSAWEMIASMMYWSRCRHGVGTVDVGRGEIPGDPRLQLSPCDADTQEATLGGIGTEVSQ
eukprot:scaffold1352_cov144-Cylindrotheca_fusiformis.AAC.6